ncbi:MAG: response regulator transcription factor [Lyngbya sp. HA4199-MV5]|jgi:DNA-binding NarL/FixJ family response regulator|nr:response regulator transcription factor [Lyngbya sp. HA4199-MV5]
MTSILFLLKNDLNHLNRSTQVDDSGNSSINHAFTAIALEVAGLLQDACSDQAEAISSTKAMDCDRSETVAIRAIEPEHRQIIEIEPLSERELEVLQLIVDGHRNPAIARKLYITQGTVKSHVRNILKKLCVSDRTQAAIRALRSGLVF